MAKTPLLHLSWACVLYLFILAACRKHGSDTSRASTWSDSVNISAGTGTAGFKDGNIFTAMFNNPRGLTMDAQGNVYVADMSNNRIRKITPDGIVSTLAGVGSSGFIDGFRSGARFHSPVDVAVDAAGNIFSADMINNSIRKITSEGQVTTFAGKGLSDVAVYQDGPLSSALFYRPRGLAIDAAGNLYVSERENNRIRKISPDGMVTTLAGDGKAGFADGKGTAAEFNMPRDIILDEAGNIYVADAGNNRIRKVRPDGTVSTFAGNGTAGFADGPADSAQFNSPMGICADKKGNIYIGDTGNNRIRKIGPDGRVTTIAGDGTPGFSDAAGKAAKFNQPKGIVVDAGGTILYVADEANNRIRKIGL